MSKSTQPTPLVSLPGGTFVMGSTAPIAYPEEGPERTVTVQPFQLEQHLVTNSQFAEFVRATGYLTTAERAPDPADFPAVPPDLLVPGSLVFTPTEGPVDLRDWQQWWNFVPGAHWRHPEGPGSSTDSREDHPVVQVSYEDAQAYARWRGRRLPTEQELEYAARAGRAPTTYAWGEEIRPDGELMANTWQGQFPFRNNGVHGWERTTPVHLFPPNPWGLYDTIGNVWEWTSTYYTTGADRDAADHLALAGSGQLGMAQEIQSSACCNPDRGETLRAQLQTLATAPGEPTPRRVVKGGSHLCAPEYCLRYRPPARQGQSEDSATTHIGFRCAR